MAGEARPVDATTRLAQPANNVLARRKARCILKEVSVNGGAGRCATVPGLAGRSMRMHID